MLKFWGKNKSKGEDSPSSSWEDVDVSMLRKLLQGHGHNPWTSRAISDIVGIPDLETKFGCYCLLYKQMAPAQQHGPALWLLWETCKKAMQRKAEETMKCDQLQKQLSDMQGDRDGWKALAQSLQMQIGAARDAVRENKQKERDLEDQLSSKQKVEQENQVLLAMVKKMTLEQGHAPGGHDRCEGIIKQLKTKLGFASQTAVVTREGWRSDEEVAGCRNDPLDPSE